MRFLNLAAIAAASLAAVAAAPASAQTETAVFAGGCFWSTQTDLASLPGVVATTVGYTGGTVANPTYEQVSTRTTGHREAIRIVFDPARVSYARLVDRYLHTIDPTDAGGTFCDRGDEYRTAVFAQSPAQARVAAALTAALARDPRFKGRPIATQVRGGAPFYAAETYHQDYHHKNPVHYRMYRVGCGRDRQLRAIWGEAPGDWKS